jgi:hypothetical protein
MIDDIVYKCIKDHKGGEKFFDALDDMVRNNETLFNFLMDLIPEEIQYNSFNIVVSGNFGIKFKNWFNKSNHSNINNCICLNGSLRTDNIDKKYYGGYYKNQFCYQESFGGECIAIPTVFIDDSFFMGRTSDKVEKYVYDVGGEWCGIIVAYDGSKTPKRKDLKCLYRYYDRLGEIK